MTEELTLEKSSANGGETPYQVNGEQVLRAVRALCKHMFLHKRKKAESKKKDLLLDVSSTSSALEDEPLWLLVTGKKFVSDRVKLKPYKISVPHSLCVAPTANVCLFTADPQRTYKDLIGNEMFPGSLRSLIGRVIGISKLKKKFKSYESRRLLASQHTHFLADERIVTYLPHLLGKGFFHSSSKRPVPVCLTGNSTKRTNKEIAAKNKKARRAYGDLSATLHGTPLEISKEITKSLNCVLVNLSLSTGLAIRVAMANWPVEHVKDNIEATLKGLLEPDAKRAKIFPGGWHNVKAINVKGSNTASLPLWLADELWTDKSDIMTIEGGKDVEKDEGLGKVTGIVESIKSIPIKK